MHPRAALTCLALLLTGCSPEPFPIAVANATTDTQRVLAAVLADPECRMGAGAAQEALATFPLQELVIAPNDHEWLEYPEIYDGCGYVRVLTEKEREYLFSFRTDKDGLFDRAVIRLDGAAEVVEPTTSDALELVSSREVAWAEPSTCQTLKPLPAPRAPSAQGGPEEVQAHRFEAGCSELTTESGVSALCGVDLRPLLPVGSSIEWSFSAEPVPADPWNPAPSRPSSLELSWVGGSILWRRAPLGEFPLPRETEQTACVSSEEACYFTLDLRSPEGELIERATLGDGAALEVLQVEQFVCATEEPTGPLVTWIERRGGAP